MVVKPLKHQIMSDKEKTPDNKSEEERRYPGVAIDRADDDKVDPALIKERTHILGNNPRDND